MSDAWSAAGGSIAGRPAARLRPLGVSELLDGAVRAVRRNAGLAFAIALPFAVIRAGSSALVDLNSGRSTGSSLQSLLIGLLVGGAMATIVTAVLAPVFTADQLGHRLGGRALAARVRPSALAVVALAVVVAIAETVGLALFVVGGVWLWGLWAVAAPALTNEGLSIGAALARSSALVGTRFWRVWGIRALGWVVTVALGLLVQAPFLALAGYLSGVNPFSGAATELAYPGVYVAVTAVGSLLALTLTMPLTAAVDTLLYSDLRVRAEGMDLQLALPASTTPATGAPVTAW